MPKDRKPKTNPDMCDADKASGGKCGHEAGWGTDHVGFGRCKFHGGSTESGKKSAINEQVEVMRRTLIGEGYSSEGIDPAQLLLEELARSYSIVRWLEEMIAGDDTGDETGLAPGRAGGYAIGSSLIDIETTQGGIRYKTNIYWSQYDKAREHMARVAKDCLVVGIKEREIQLYERQGELMHRLLTAIFSDEMLALSPEQRVKAPAVARKHLALLPAPKENVA